jgi:CheY-like chemotaxis protein
MEPSAKSMSRHTLPWSGSVKRVLVVEDDPDQTMLLRDYLESYFYRVTAVANGVDALKAILEKDFDVILCDVVMPQMPGDKFYYAVQRVKPHLCERFVFITAHGESPRIQEFLNQVSEMVLMKPFHLDDLLEMILLLFRELENPKYKLTASEAGSRPLALRPPMNLRDRT